MYPVPSFFEGVGGNITLSHAEFQTVYSHWSPWYKPKQTQKLSGERNNHSGVIALFCFVGIFRFFILIFCNTQINGAKREGVIEIVLAVHALTRWREIYQSLSLVIFVQTE